MIPIITPLGYLIPGVHYKKMRAADATVSMKPIETHRYFTPIYCKISFSFTTLQSRYGQIRL